MNRDPIPAPPRAKLRRVFLLLLLGCALAAWFAGWKDFVNVATLERHRSVLVAFVAERPLLACGAFVLVYVVATALSLPGAAFLTLAGGFLFGAGLATVLVATGATIGAAIVFSVARTALAEPLRARAGPRFERLAAGFRKDAFFYLLALRLVPLFPFWLVNLAPAFFGVRLGPFLAATAIGIVPATFVYASLGSGLGSLIEKNRKPDLDLLLEPAISLPLLGLALLALAPVLWRHLAGRADRRA
ncbi:MAG: VTT domain-containing protein [Geminicoccaceae bacterium]|nr:VTT domain-containing protein [Geminicoccaceae bacterium]MCS7266817.1 VTT domain-containing protein [Geminicoccaceae bacterium]MDW8123331.1 VTT domain-containing protein [Geminicoccaceae bacterium]MDW8342060.1 VTT domain-containing protein [Geminicoccaceae bacterium]